MNRPRDYLWGVLVLLGLWQLGAWIGGENAISSPWVTFRTLFHEAGATRFWGHIGASSFRIMAALIVSFIAGVPLGLYLGSNNKADRIAKPLIYLTYPVPKIVFLPLALLMFGLGDLSKIMMLSLILFFQLLITTRDAARNVSRSAKHALRSLGGNRFDLFAHVIWPATLPAVFTALRIATGTVVAVLFFVESLGTRYGMGFYILDAWGRADIPQIYVGIVVLALMGVILYETFDILEKVYCRWSRL